MRIISIVTLVTPNGEYGGPVRVALNQARALREAGHDVTVAGGARGYGSQLPSRIDGIPVQLFPAVTALPGIGFAGLAAPALQRWLHEVAPSADIVHVHAARDFVTLPAAGWLRRHRIPYAIQTHGMIDRSTNPLAGPLDLAITRGVLRNARAVFHLTDREHADLIRVAGSGIALVRLRNGVPRSHVGKTQQAQIEVLYLARLAPRKRPRTFVEMALRLSRDFPTVRFTLVGPDEGEAASVSRLIEESKAAGSVEWEGPLSPEDTIDRMARASIYVLPSIDEPYPMSVLEAMSVGLPVVVTDSCGLASAVRRIGCGMVVDDSLAALISAVDSLLRDPALAEAQGRAGANATRVEFGMEAIAEALVEAYSG